MIKLTRHIEAVIVVVIFILINNIQSRSPAVSSYHHLNGITILADSIANGKGKSSYHITDDNGQNSSNHNDKDNANDTNNDDDNSPGIWKDLSMIYRIYQQCANENLSVCLKVKLLTGLERVLHTTKTLRIIDGVQFVKSDGSGSSGGGDDDDNDDKANIKRLLSEEDIEATLPRSNEAKDQHLNNLIFKKLAAFLREHTLQVKFPDVRSPEQFNSNSIESRKKKDKKGGGAYIMIPLLLGGTFVPIAYGALAMLAGKALIVSKLALVLASIIGIKKLLSGGGGKEAHEVVVSSGGHSGWGRDIDLAYNGWKPGKESEKIV